MSDRSTRAGATLRVASWNIHACVGSDGEFRPDRIADVIDDIGADIVGLQEVENRRYAGHDVVTFLSQRLDMHAWAGPTLQRGAGDYGNLLLARGPATSIRRHVLSQPGREPRGAIEATFDCGQTRLRLITTHLGLSARERGRQLETLLQAIDGNVDDVVVMLGDFNEWRPFGRVNRCLTARFGRQPRLRSFPASKPALALDRVLVSPPEVCKDMRTARSSSAVLASDHLPVCADLRLERPVRAE